MGHFYYALRAFDILDRIDTDEQQWLAKRGAIIGILQQLLTGKESKDRWGHAMVILKQSKNAQAELMFQKLSEIKI